MKNLDKYIGCLLGGAAGDALGYAVEFLSDELIFLKYGENGIRQYNLSNGKALISDDTQMTLFTANGLISSDKTENCIRCIYENYLDWLATQQNNKKFCGSGSRLLNTEELWSARAPGGTCLSALESGIMGSVSNPINDSKGCGGVMRVAPIGLCFDKELPIEQVDMLGAEAAAITHGHELGYIPAAMLVHIVHLISHNDKITLLEAINDASSTIKKLFPFAQHLDELLMLTEKAIELSTQNMDDLDAIRSLGEGWVAEETLAIAIYCALKYQNNFDSALIAAVNHSGDSDSTGAVCGNILGAYLGVTAVPEKYLVSLELRDVIIEYAEKLTSYKML